MSSDKTWYVKSADGNVYGPADSSMLVQWAQDGRIQPTSFLSQDRINWMPAQKEPALEMKWLVEVEPGKVLGPFNRAVVIRLFKEGSALPGTKFYVLHEYAPDEDPPPKIVEKIVEKVVEKIVEKEVRVEVPVEPPPRREVVVPEVVEPVASIPPSSSLGSIFGKLNRDKLAALEAAAQRELAETRKKGFSSKFFGRS